MSVVLPCVEEVSAVRVHMTNDLRSPEARLTVARSIREVERRFEKKVSSAMLITSLLKRLPLCAYT